ncbi:MAG TPA: hypothetical protein VKZ91_02155 [Woeseiaceae bacterium]|nr:hypothetical protein [Woeseiaceae bacterium]
MKKILRPLLLAASMPIVFGSAPNAIADHPATGLVRTVLQSTERFRDPAVARAEGYRPGPSCASSPEEGAMGVHYVNEALVGDGVLDATQPELLVYEPEPDGRRRLVAVEYLVLADAWHASNPEPPVLEGQLFHYIGAPNRLGLPALYELHVWAWKKNPHGMFADWNPRASCENFVPSE